jgi:hypothetical protein
MRTRIRTLSWGLGKTLAGSKFLKCERSEPRKREVCIQRKERKGEERRESTIKREYYEGDFVADEPNESTGTVETLQKGM